MTEGKKLTLKLKFPVSVPIRPKKEIIIAPKELVREKPKPEPQTKAPIESKLKKKSYPKQTPSKKLIIPHKEYERLFIELCKNYPELFDIKSKRVKVLATGTHKEIREALGWSAKITRDFLGIFCHTKQYLSKCVKGAKRYNLKGEIVGEVE